MSVEQDGLDAEHFQTVSIMIISHLLKGHCITSWKNHALELPCKSYFTSSLVAKFGKEGHTGIPVKGFQEILEQLGIGNPKNDYNEGKDNHYHESEVHDDHRKRRETDSMNNFNSISNSKQVQCML